MKTKFTYLWMVVMTMVLALGFTACSDDDEPAGSSASILGSWETTTDSGSDHLLVTFNSGKRGELTVTSYDDKGNELQSITQGFEYDYREAERLLYIIGSALDADYRVVLSASTLRLIELDYRGEETGRYYELVRR